MNREREDFEMPEIDRVIHEPARLAILTVLSSCAEADFLFLERITKLTRGNLSVQLTRLAEAGMIEVEKRIEHKRTLTTAKLTDKGRQELNTYWESMNVLRSAAKVKTGEKRGFFGGGEGLLGELGDGGLSKSTG